MYWKNKSSLGYAMSGFSNLNKRISYRGGNTEGRLEKDKLISLYRALHNSYQAETAILEDGRKFKCLINPDKNKPAYDNKILSIPYLDVCLNESSYPVDSQGRENISIHTGSVFTWEETDTHWIVYLQYLEESAYFRAEIRKCESQVNINNKRYWAYIRGPVETSVQWNQKGGVEWNDLNYSLVMFITKDENTESYFHRFKKIKIQNPVTGKEEAWKVVNYNGYYGDGIIQVFLDEAFENSIEDEVALEKPELPTPKPEDLQILGPNEVVKYDTVVFEALNFKEKGAWYIIDGGEPEKEIKNNSNVLYLDIIKSKGSFTLIYRTSSEEIRKEIKIIPF